jgi:hypothetical protein
MSAEPGGLSNYSVCLARNGIESTAGIPYINGGCVMMQTAPGQGCIRLSGHCVAEC